MTFSSSSAHEQPSVKIKKFVSEAEVEEQRQQRQQEWERVRKPEDPKEAPEEPVDHRSLYERLQEQKNKKDADYAEQFSLRNQVRTLDTDEVDFLHKVSNEQLQEERQRQQEEDEVLQTLRSAVRPLHESHELLVPEVKRQQAQPASGKRSQKTLLAGIVKKKRSDSQEDVNADHTPIKLLRSEDSSASLNRANQNLPREKFMPVAESVNGRQQSKDGVFGLKGLCDYSESDSDS